MTVGLLAFLIFSACAWSAEYPLSVLSLNLHGYHPMGEAVRFAEDRKGAIEAADSDIFFFSMDELDRGHRVRLERLAESIAALSPDVILLQEVGAGAPGLPKDCATFFADRKGDGFALNSARRLQRRLPQFELSLACRGNTGWWTTPDTFRERRIFRETAQGREVVFDFGANPYPSGILVEGLAILVRKPWILLEQEEWRLDLGGGRSFFVQMAKIGNGHVTFVVANVHAGHKILHFEQAVALRRWLARHAGSENLLIGGDFNALLYREGSPDSSTIPWEIEVPGYFDFSSPDSRSELIARLTALNRDERYKPWANLDPKEAEVRISVAVDSYYGLVRESAGLREALDWANKHQHCHPGVADARCFVSDRIDHLFATPGWRVENAFIAFSGNSWSSLRGVSDHPGVFARWSISDQKRK